MTNTKKGKTNLTTKALMVGTALAAFGSVNQTDAAQITNAGMNVIVLEAISIVATDPLQFGRITAGTGSAGTVVIDTAGARTSTGNVTEVGSTGFQAGLITVTASGSTPMTVSVAAPTVLSGGGGANMAVSDLDIAAAGGVQTSITGLSAAGTVNTTGDATFPVGGTLAVADGQGNGTYTGTYTVNANYE